jgi:MoaA/NifB/PqqE/SkfB family radical SAM enzyme
MKLEDIGFYTLSDERAKNSSVDSQLQRCELLLTGRCNFKCPYCRSIGGADISFKDAQSTIDLWAEYNLKSVRFSGGEPTLWSYLTDLCKYSKDKGIQRVAISSNGSANIGLYEKLILAGADDFSISLDACCAEDGDKMAGGIKGAWSHVLENLKFISSKVYTTVGIVLTADNENNVVNIINVADDCGVSDIRIIPAAQYSNRLHTVLYGMNLDKFPILKFRVEAFRQKLPMRGLSSEDSHMCSFVLDDMAVMNNEHYPCIIYLREGGKAIGAMNHTFRTDRAKWFTEHDTHADPICKSNCLDFCRHYNNKWEEFHAV